VTKVKFKFAWADAGGRPAPEPPLKPDDAYAGRLDIGTSIYAVKGYARTFRLAARSNGRLILYEAEKNPNAEKGADLLDLGTNVTYIGIHSPGDDRKEIATIKDSVLLNKLVRMVLDAPMIQYNGVSSEPFYFITIHFRDGTTTSRAYKFNSRELSPGIMLPPEFGNAVRDALKRAGHSPPK
jgi:hypothetical protein